MKFAIVRFPGSNCEGDCQEAIALGLGCEVQILDYRSEPSKDWSADCLILPGGFSFGDYLRAGALAKAAPVMRTVRQFVHTGKLVLGICNGFQILLEEGLLPGVLLPNSQERFLCKRTTLLVRNATTPFTNLYSTDERINMPVAHGAGNYHVSDEELKRLRQRQQIVFEYEEDINGSVGKVAGVCNESGNVLGLMPHPERCYDKYLGGDDGIRLFQSVLRWHMSAAITS